MRDTHERRSAYVCGPLTELPSDHREEIKRFYERIADVCAETMGVRAFVPHEHFDPIKNASATPDEVDRAERKQVENSSILIAVPIASSWGSGIEVEMANGSGVPTILLCEAKRLKGRLISRLLLGNPGVVEHIVYANQDECLEQLHQVLTRIMAIS